MKRLRHENINCPVYYEKVWSEEYHQNNNHRYDHARLLDLLKYVKPGDKVMDLGAGLFGACQYAVHHMKDLYPGTEFHCIDYSYTARDIALKDFPELRYELGDATATASKNDAFDVVIASELVEHLEDPKQLAKEMARICKPSGWMMLSTVDPECEDAKRDKRTYPEHVWQFEPDDLVKLFEPYGKATYYRLGNYHMLEVQK